ncbi:uracil phosphoribosyltransferase [Mycoplasmopsis canis UF31]|uniref:Uracil phosphoribosyltransferase n=1 Tax=Mycoplasmopsis canis TaxID=29555 RepID=A0A449AQZ2_9BACT|nr:uracil phosphoribosyltransferase [Mycoplasmopsis canis]AMD81171.1 uracil phosphoribosyltransferase [Mycoplasmopsis canis PG 14]EIE39763.1 uracil phosphoribosyltransferase [Mycoplasmopsis canis PG 14]EIE39980.1 uracil phosphoribosyltransferase [Mycoplasmopsis canis UF31]EIE40195.1 uracil phosphoribosyltransferase [Mycoplasmopsis canis UF33]EIE41550.1 uracil phosphoribosyltransferase [Mycoplasmopsis canis UFG1]
MLKIIEHPLIKIKLTKMRDVNSDHNEFRRNLNEIGSLMVYEIMRNYKPKKYIVQTPLNQSFEGFSYDKEIVLVPILRAGLGMTDGLLNLIPESRVGHIGMYRDEETLTPKEYFYKIPNVDKDSLVIVVDPMLATGNSAVDAIKRLKKDGFTNIKLVCLVGVNEGVENVEKNFGKEFEIYLASLDSKLNENGYIEPGLGDAGDRIFGTK